MTAKASEGSPMPEIMAEFAGAELGDRRRSARLESISAVMAKGPDKTLPQLFPDRSELEVTYRFFANEDVSPDACLEPHFGCTLRRIAKHANIVVPHDTTTFSFGGEARSDIGYVGPETIGFFGHFSIAVTADEARTPLGTLAVRCFARKETAEGKRGRKSPGNASESLRWQQSIEEVVERLGSLAPRAIHVMDREADAYELLAYLIASRIRFVLRLNYDRLVETRDDGGEVGSSPERVTAALARAEDVIERVVFINRRGTKGRSVKKRKTHPVREERHARLRIRGTQVTLLRPREAAKTLPETLVLNAVEAHEVDVPEGQPAVEWRLLTTEPIDSPEAIAAIVDYYRARWRIEEFFKALKTGCAFEQRQVEEASIKRLLAVTVPIAWHLLMIRSIAHAQPTAPATIALTLRQLLLLTGLSVRVPLGPNPTLRQALLAIAGLGGHLKNNGEPGWRTLGAGFQVLLAAEAAVIVWEAREIR